VTSAGVRPAPSAFAFCSISATTPVTIGAAKLVPGSVFQTCDVLRKVSVLIVLPSGADGSSATMASPGAATVTLTPTPSSDEGCGASDVVVMPTEITGGMTTTSDAPH